MLLGQVHQVEVGGERARDLVRALDREALDDLRRVRECLGCLVGVRLDRGESQPLDVVVQPLGSALAKHSAEKIAEQVHVGPHGAGDAVFGLESAD